jgi:UDP-2-acetamido-2-deoxy-ribo-hexuluronate aminotransferase
MKIEMVNLKKQYLKIKSDIDQSILNVIDNSNFINGAEVEIFANNLATYLGGNTYVIPCANGTDALQIALMSLDLQPYDEVIVPAFTYVATAEVIGLLKLTPVIVDVDTDSFNISIDEILNAITDKTKVIIPVHLYGQCANMEEIMKIAADKKLYVIEDCAQSLGAIYTFKNGLKNYAGTIGNIGCTSFFPSKNLGCYGDGGAIFTSNKELYTKIKMISNHGQVKKYVHKYIGVNSRLDTIQAAILNVKIKHLDQYNTFRNEVANKYEMYLANIDQIIIPKRISYTTHVFHQYTLQIKNGHRDSLKKYLEERGVPCMIYYPIPLNEQEAYENICKTIGDLNKTKIFCNTVLSLPIHTEMELSEQEYICNQIINYFK